METLEIEYKFCIPYAQVAMIQHKLQTISNCSWQYTKEDNYYRKMSNDTNTPVDIRIRHTTHKISSQYHSSSSMPDEEYVLTYKQRVKDENTNWVYKEQETRIDDSQSIIVLLQVLGCTHILYKKKIGWGYTIPIASDHAIVQNNIAFQVLAELSQVMQLGYFLELEVCTDPSISHENITAIRQYLLSLSSQIDILESQLEPRLYMDMLQ